MRRPHTDRTLVMPGRELWTGILVVAICSGMVGCGGGVSGSARADAAAKAYAERVDLRAGDVQGMRERPSSEARVDAARRILLCLGHSSGEVPVSVESPTFLSEQAEWWVMSRVDVMPSKARALAYVAALHSARGRVCLARGLGRGSVISATTAPPELSLGGHSASVDMVTRTQGRGSALIRVEAEFFVVGRSTIGLIAEAPSARAIPTPSLDRLLALLGRRARTGALE